MWNVKYGGFFLFFALACSPSYNGAVALKTHYWTFWDFEFHGRRAQIAGIVLLAIGFAALVQIWGLALAAFGN